MYYGYSNSAISTQFILKTVEISGIGRADVGHPIHGDRKVDDIGGKGIQAEFSSRIVKT